MRAFPTLKGLSFNAINVWSVNLWSVVQPVERLQSTDINPFSFMVKITLKYIISSIKFICEFYDWFSRFAFYTCKCWHKVFCSLCWWYSYLDKTFFYLIWDTQNSVTYIIRDVTFKWANWKHFSITQTLFKSIIQNNVIYFNYWKSPTKTFWNILQSNIKLPFLFRTCRQKFALKRKKSFFVVF